MNNSFPQVSAEMTADLYSVYARLSNQTRWYYTWKGIFSEGSHYVVTLLSKLYPEGWF